jgi:NO-binding membrane sensor protein with MHYT domain
MRLAWLTGGATAMGRGIWSMHYIGMLAFRLLVPVLCDWPTVLASLLTAIGAAALAVDLPPVLGDRVQLQQVVLNVVMNAIEAMRSVEDRPRELAIMTATSSEW